MAAGIERGIEIGIPREIAIGANGRVVDPDRVAEEDKTEIGIDMTEAGIETEIGTGIETETGIGKEERIISQGLARLLI